MAGLNDWSTTAAGNASVGAINWAEGMFAGGVNDSARALMADVAKVVDGTDVLTGWHVEADGFTLRDGSDNTKKVIFDVSGQSAGTTRTIGMPTVAGTLALTSDIPDAVSAGPGISVSSLVVSLDPSYLRGYLAGLSIGNNGTDANNDIDISAGVAVDSTNAKFLKLTSALVKRLDAAWAVGTNQGGLDTGTKANSTWYHVWLIMRSDTGVVDVLFSTSATAPTMPTNYDYKRLIGSVLTDSSGNIRAFKQTGDHFQWGTAIQDVNDASGHTTSRTLRTLSVPPGRKVLANIRALSTTVSDFGSLIQDPDESDDVPNTTMTPPGSTFRNSTGHQPAVTLKVMTNTSSQIATRAAGSGAALDILTVGYTDRRGRDD